MVVVSRAPTRTPPSHCCAPPASRPASSARSSRARACRSADGPALRRADLRARQQHAGARARDPRRPHRRPDRPVVICDRADAAGLERREASDSGLRSSSRQPRHGPRRPRAPAVGERSTKRRKARRARGLHADPGRRLRQALAGAAPQHPPVPAARLPRPAHAPPGARGGRSRARLHGAFRRRGTRCRARSHPGQARRAAGRGRKRLSARVQRLEHIIYPRAVGWFAAGRLAWRDGTALDSTDSPRARRSSRRRHEGDGDRRACAPGGGAPRGRGRGRSLAPFVAEYDVRYGRMAVGTSRTELAAANGHWTLESTSTATGFARVIASGTLRQRSEFELLAGRPAAAALPVRRRHRTHGPRRRARVRLARRARARHGRGRARGPRDGPRPAGRGIDAGPRARAAARRPRARHDRDDREGQGEALPLHAPAPRDAQDRDRRRRDRRLPERARRLGPRDAHLACAEARLRRRAGRAARSTASADSRPTSRPLPAGRRDRL